ncbi:MAG TPA: hypothetical protein VMU42_17330 [Candidatus Sulfotelmatobacter sp.]|nr:hypothetical protein [Candidatus Sulfotelmatobacter sp.]
MTKQLTAVALNWRHQLWLVLLVAASVAFSFGFACAVPLAAFGAVAALTLSRRDALLFIAAVWLANQIVGYGFLNYPWDAISLAWGAALGIVALLATLAARWTAFRLDRAGHAAVWCLAFLAAFAVYEGALFVVAATALGGTEDFAPAIVGRIFSINALGFAGLIVLNRLGATIGLAARISLPLPARRHA